VTGNNVVRSCRERRGTGGEPGILRVFTHEHRRSMSHAIHAGEEQVCRTGGLQDGFRHVQVDGMNGWISDPYIKQGQVFQD
jgi:hypothetical protein